MIQITRTKEVVNITETSKEKFEEKLIKVNKDFREKGYLVELVNLGTNITPFVGLFTGTVRGYIVEREWNENESKNNNSRAI